MKKEEKCKELLVLIPHASTKRPSEIKKEWLSKNQRYLLYSQTSETDRYTNKLYDFRNIIANKQIVFPYSQIYINICKDPAILNKSVPVSIRGIKVYRKGKELRLELRKKIARKYFSNYFKKIKSCKKSIILAGHSTISGHSSLDGKKLRYQIVLSNCMIDPKTKQKFFFAPYSILKIYAKELRKRLPGVKIGFNSIYTNEIDITLYKFGSDKLNLKKKVPIIHQETDESLYIKNNKLQFKKLNKLRKAFALSLYSTIKKLKKLK